ncbi:nuclear fragile X mental retardation-interacting protein 2 isoform X1 [Microcaecilia unicolor]|uniref:Nuclear fragile X mental retardation-interacting protein 2-like isoform X1 n=2 Tax=Microcaecilia unicolor TaxID=1415580 RepID=A0A6P7YD65_9AMPH|nr:nuclear fragile X mental retardation-interacting protein 2-like isoform X1 [Microcaecilia unicolor]XP_030065426.1 nuclear fragile X mental retardation-interacting protein 2-like isoform X1 [Microcaecilia unicolor]XP_030065427.1 nuclear fragile X mental retardation-interacting protein 2-like isoform X1 [Microcaecilia unicolor]
MQKGIVASDENMNPQELWPSRKKEKYYKSEAEGRIRTKSGSWDTNGCGPDPEIETVSSRNEESTPLSPSNSMNIRNLQISERETIAPRQTQRPPAHHYSYHRHQSHYTDRSGPFQPGFRRNFRDFERKYRRDWVPRQNNAVNGYRPQHSGGISFESRGYTRMQKTKELLGTFEEQKGDSPEPHTVPTGSVKTGVNSASTHRSPGVADPPQPRDKVEGKPTSSTAGREETWSPFKQPPVFPVDNSSARTLPKISYASKVKENLEKRTPEPAVTSAAKTTMVPASAVKTTNSLPNCVLSTSQNDSYRTGATAATSAAFLPTSGAPSSPATPEPVPLRLESSPSSENGQSAPGSPPCAYSQNKEHLGAIFQNEWGLSFINDPNAGQAVSAGETPPLVPTNVLEVAAETEPQACQESASVKDWEAVVWYHMQEWDQLWNLHKLDPARVTMYSEPTDGKG